jgi:5-methylcytosine-specific restriction endonuclease McrA
MHVISWKRAIRMISLGKVEVVEEYDRIVHSVTLSIRMPSVVRLLWRVKRPNRTVKFCRANIYARDRYTCQYCGRRHTPDELTYDHVVPKSRGGRTEWENIVTACFACNRKKGNRIPVEAKMRLMKRPRRPDWIPVVNLRIRLASPPDAWKGYLFLE